MPRSSPRNEKQDQILKFIQQQIRLRGFPPSVREIGEAVNLKSTSTVHGHLERLERRGLIRRDLTKPRAIEVVGDEPLRNVVSLPLVGKVAAGVPITAVENVEDRFTLSDSFVGEGNHFILTVQGDSMVDAGIFSGDYVVVRQQETAINGDIVVAMIDDAATVKSFHREGDHIRLQPHNPVLEPIIVKECAILGKVVALLRQY